MDWKQKIDDWEERQKLATEERRRADNEAKRNIEIQRAEAEQEARLRFLAKSFRCHICDKPSQKPKKTYWSEGSPGYGVPGSSGTSTDWSLPGDMTACKLCKKWTCDEHIHNGICQTCAEKLS